MQGIGKNAIAIKIYFLPDMQATGRPRLDSHQEEEILNRNRGTDLNTHIMDRSIDERENDGSGGNRNGSGR